MALGYLDDSKLYAIASAIRAKTGDSSTMSVDDMPDEIGSITTGAQVEPLSVTENGTYSAPTGYAYSPVTVNVSGGGGGITVDQVAMRTISGAVAGNATSIGSYAFQNCSQLVTASFPNATTIGGSAFCYCSSLETAAFPRAVSIGPSAFYNCRRLAAIDCPSATDIGAQAFYGCSSLTHAEFLNATLVGTYAFYGCSKLAEANIPNATAIPTYAFYGCFSLETTSFQNAQTVWSSAFYSCSKLSAISLPSLKSMYSTAFRACVRLTELHLEGVTSVPLLSGGNHFMSTPIGGYSTMAGRYGSVFVPASLYESFLTAKNWSSISSRIVSVP